MTPSEDEPISAAGTTPSTSPSLYCTCFIAAIGVAITILAVDQEGYTSFLTTDDFAHAEVCREHSDIGTVIAAGVSVIRGGESSRELIKGLPTTVSEHTSLLSKNRCGSMPTTAGSFGLWLMWKVTLVLCCNLMRYRKTYDFWHSNYNGTSLQS